MSLSWARTIRGRSGLFDVDEMIPGFFDMKSNTFPTWIRDLLKFVSYVVLEVHRYSYFLLTIPAGKSCPSHSYATTTVRELS